MSADKTLGPLEVGYYSTTDAFRAIDQHAAVMRSDRSLVAVTGPSTGKGAMGALDCAHLFAAAPDLLDVVETWMRSMQKTWVDGPPITHPQFDLYNWAKNAVTKAKGGA